MYYCIFTTTKSVNYHKNSPKFNLVVKERSLRIESNVWLIAVDMFLKLRYAGDVFPTAKSCWKNLLINQQLNHAVDENDKRPNDDYDGEWRTRLVRFLHQEHTAIYTYVRIRTYVRVVFIYVCTTMYVYVHAMFIYVCVIMYVCTEYMYVSFHVCTQVCVFVCIYVYNVYKHVYMYISMYVCMYVWTVWMYVCMYACMYVCMHACIWVCMYAYVCMYVCMYSCMNERDRSN